MFLQTNSYIVPKEQREAHARILTAFRETLARLGCDFFEVYEQVGSNWDATETTGRFVQIMRFRDREHQLAVQAAERADREAQARIAEFCELINFPYQQEHGFFAVGFYINALSSELAEGTQASAELGGNEAPEGAYLDQELDELAGDFGAPPMRIAPDESEPEPIEDDAFAQELDEQGGHPGPGGDAIGGQISNVLDPALLEDELDEAMPAELIDDEEDVESHAVNTQPNRGGKRK